MLAMPDSTTEMTVIVDTLGEAVPPRGHRGSPVRQESFEWEKCGESEKLDFHGDSVGF